jgi:hypothetical protein
MLLQNEDDEVVSELWEDSYVPAVYVNQWRFRSAYGVQNNAEFFFNDGSLNRDEILDQLTHVLLSYELVGAKVLGIVSDAGGNNAGLIKLLRAGRRPNLQLEQVEPNLLVTFVNPFDPTRRVAIWLCSTHNLKSMRNHYWLAG